MYSVLCTRLLEGCAEGGYYFKVEEMKNINFQNLEIFSVNSKRSFTFSKYENIFHIFSFSYKYEHVFHIFTFSYLLSVNMKISKNQRNCPIVCILVAYVLGFSY